MTVCARTMVTGSRGLLGATLMRAFPDALACQADIRDAAALRSEIAAACPGLVLHTAAKTSVAECERDPGTARAVNVHGSRNVVDAARSVGARVVYISTASVFKGDVGNYREEDLPEPVNVYSATKREGELHVLDYEKGVVLRLNLVGIHPEGSRRRNFLEWLFDSVLSDEDLNLFTDSFVNPMSNWTTALMIGKIIKANSWERVVHIGTRDVLSKADIGKLVIAEVPGYAGTVRYSSVHMVADGVVRPEQMSLNTDRARALLGPMPSFAQELATILARAPAVGR